LLRFDARGLPQYDLVESMGINQDGTIYNFSLHKDAVWQDGQPVTSDDVVFTIDLLRSKDLPVPDDVRTLWQAVEVKALNKNTLQFHLPEPYSPFLDYLTFGILPKHLLNKVDPKELMNSDFNLKPVGSGPYQLDQPIVENGQITGLVLKSFSDYYGQKPFIEQIVFQYYPDSQSALSAYHNGEVQGISEITPDVLPAALKEPDLNLYTGRLPQLTLVFLNLDNPKVPFFQDVNVRRALMMGLNRQRMVDQQLDGQAIIADSPIFPGSWAYYDGIEHIDYDPDQAISLLKEAGYTIPAEGGEVRANEDGDKLAFDLLHPDNPEYTALAKSIAQDWSKLGIEVNLKPVSYDELVSDHLDPRIYQAALVDLNLSRSPDPDPYPFWHQAQITGGQNYSKWDDRQASEFLEQARVTVDIGERTRLYRNFQVRFAADLPALPLFYPVYTYGVDSQVQGVTMGPLFDPSDRFATISSWYLLSSRQAGGTAMPEAGAAATSSP
jgi:peptide/nickel transport system substrate-binding protein